MKFEFKKGERAEFVWAEEGLFADIFCLDEKVGMIGILPEKLSREVSPNGTTIWFSLELDLIYLKTKNFKTYKPLAQYPGSTHDFSVLFDKGYFSLVEILDGFKYSYLAKRDYVTWFEPKDLKEKKISYTFRYLLQSEDKTLNADDIEDFRVKFTKFLKKNNLELRS